MEPPNNGRINFTIGLGQIIHQANQNDLRECVNEQCKQKNPLRFALANLPEVLTIGIVWNVERPSVDYISDIMNLISRQVKVEEIFDSVVLRGTYTLRGMIAYYGLHYNAYIRNPQSEEWLGFDDSRVNKVRLETKKKSNSVQIGSSWDDVVAKCCSGHWQPSVLWYEYTP
jgi:ubiquitin C-terminal hydrolase